MSSAAANKTRKVFDNRYEILSIVGRGHCSVVYHARHVMVPTSEVALKVLLEQKDQRSNAERLRREALAMVSARHRYVIRLDDFHSVGDLCYLSMEYAPESDLRKFTDKRGGTLEIAQGENFLQQCLEALSHIHKVGIVHRDIKPDNILVANEYEVRLGDFGVAVIPGMASSLDELARGVGTMDYMAPEVLNATGYEPRSDLYALAVSFYELLSGKHPFANVSMVEQLSAREDRNLVPLSTVAPDVPGYLSRLIMRAMSFAVTDRYSSAKEMLRALTQAKGSGAERIPRERDDPAARGPRTARSGRRSKSRGKSRDDLAPGPSPDAQGGEITATEEQSSTGGPSIPTAALASTTEVAAPSSSEPREPTSSSSTGQIATDSRAPTPPGVTPVPASRSSDHSVGAAPSNDSSPASAEADQLLDFDDTLEQLFDLGPDEPAATTLELQHGSQPTALATPSAEPQYYIEQPKIKDAPGTEPPITVEKTTTEISPMEEHAPPIESSAPPVPPARPARVRERGDDDTDSAGPTTRIEPTATPAVATRSPAPPPTPASTPPSERPDPTLTARVSRSKTMRIDREMVERIRAQNAGLTPATPGIETANSSTESTSHDATSPRPGLSLSPARKRRFLSYLTVVLFVVALVCVTVVLKFNHNIDVTQSTLQKSPEPPTVAENGTASSSLSANPAATQFTFPRLPKGVYSGTISGIVSDRDLPLTFISFPKRSQLIIIIGIEGWRPTTAAIDQWEASGGATDPAKPLRIAANGFLLELSGQSTDGSLVGSYVNLVNGDEGAWRATLNP